MKDPKIIRKTILNDKPRKTGQGTRLVHLVDTPEYQAKVEQIYEYIKQGMRSNEIFVMMMIEDETLSDEKFTTMLKHAYVFAENALHKDREYVFQLHMDRYEKIYEKQLVMTNVWGKPLDPKSDWAVISARYANAIKALESKEKLLGLHDKAMVVEFNEQKAVMVETDESKGVIPGFSIDKLTLAEQKELLEIIREARTVPLEGVQRVTMRKTVIEINPITGTRNVKQDTETIDVTYEDMPPDVVTKMKNVRDPEDEPEPDMGAIVIDNRPKVEQKQAEEIQEDIKRNLLQAFKEKMKEKRPKRN